MTAFDNLKKAAFAGIEIPVSEVVVKGGIRLHEHEFPHSPGAELEPMGRAPYRIHMVGVFHNIPGSALDRAYPQLYPDRLTQLMDLAELETSDDLLIPTIGKMKAIMRDWERRQVPSKSLSGEDVTFDFVEDQDVASLATTLPTFRVAQLQNLSDDLAAKAAIAAFNSTAATGIFQKINDAVTAVLAFQGLADAYTRVVVGKIQGLVDLCGQADQQIVEFQDPKNFLVLEALKNLWFAAVQLGDDALGKGTPLHQYKVPKRMSISQVSTSIYGTAERAMEIMQLNEIPDPFAIVAGTTLTYYQDAA